MAHPNLQVHKLLAFADILGHGEWKHLFVSLDEKQKQGTLDWDERILWAAFKLYPKDRKKRRTRVRAELKRWWRHIVL